MMKSINFILATLCCLAIVSCSKSKDATLTPDSSKIKGELKEYFTVVEKPYVIKYDEKGFNHYMISIELQRTDVPFAFDKEGIEPVGYSGATVRGNFGIGIDIFDADGNMALTWSPTADGFSGVYSSDDLENLFTLDSGETGFVRWSTNDLEKYDNKNFTFKVSSSLKINKVEPSRSYGDNIYDSYEAAVNQAARAMENAINEAASAMEDAMSDYDGLFD